jgi:cytidylate kinase
VAPLGARLARARERLGLDEDSAARRLHEADRNLERYIREFYGRGWDDALNYHMILNTDALGYDGTVAQILTAVESLGWSPAS